MTAVASDVKEVEAREQEEAVNAAEDRAAREAFEQRWRLLQKALLSHSSMLLIFTAKLKQPVHTSSN